MTKYDHLESIGGETHLLELMKVLNPRSIIGLSNQIVFNENDSFTRTGEIILFYLDDGIYTLGITVQPDKNTFKVLYYETDSDDDSYLFTFNNVPYDITEEWHFQLSTIKHMPFSFEFHEELKAFVKYCLTMI